MVHGIGSAATRSISINRDTEDVSRCSLSKIYIYMYARVPSWLLKEVVYIELIFTFISFSAKREEENKIRVFFFFHHWNPAVVEIRLFKYISFLSDLVIILTWNIDWLIGLPIIWVTFRTKPPPVGQYLRRACSFYPMNLTFRCTIIVLSRRLAVRFKF